jgi:hypothetical protein
MLQLTARQAGKQVRQWRDGGLPRRDNDIFQLLEDLAFAAAGAAISSQAELKMLEAQIEALKERVLVLEQRAAESRVRRRTLPGEGV